MNRALDVEISLVNTSNRELLRVCLDSLPAACEGLDWHVTVVDNLSDDGSAEMVAEDFPWAGLLRNSHRLGVTDNHNQVIRPALENGTVRYVLLLNEDTEVAPSSITTIVRFCDERPEIGLSGGYVVGPDGVEQPAQGEYPTLVNEFLSSLLPARRPHIPDDGWVGTCFALVRTEALREIGPLDERFFIFYDDTDLGVRLRNAGWKNTICRDAMLIHHEHQTVGSSQMSVRMELQWLRSRYLYFEKHHSRFHASAVHTAVRAALVARAAKALMASIIFRNPEERRLARLLVTMVRFNPRSTLPHELAKSAG